MNNIEIAITKDKYQFLVKTLDSHQGFLKKLGVGSLIKDSLVRDVHVIKSIIQGGVKK